ncbi:MAG: hypothetical protein JWR46_4006 [Mycobacterium sp.]|jgi:hypothetical protein|nr:hypothetical protein [Mycobacterium sp.]MCW2733070.1 hypothetical protein [Mycobacterium sp.]
MQSLECVLRWRVLRACGHNPLVRGVDRVEMLIVALGILVALVSVACAGALGTAVHEARSRVYITQAQTRHALTATATKDSIIVLRGDDSTATRVNARWQVDGTEHSATLNWDRPVKTGDPLTIWVDRHGDHVDPPAPTSQAAKDAVAVAYVVWQMVALATAGLVCLGRAYLDRRRDSAWERDIRCLIDDNGGRTNRKP